MDRLQMKENYGELLVEVMHNKTLARFGIVIFSILFIGFSVVGTYFTAFPMLVSLGLCISVQERPCFQIYEKAVVALPAIGPIKKIYPISSLNDISLAGKKMRVFNGGKTRSFTLWASFLDKESVEKLKSLLANRAYNE